MPDFWSAVFHAAAIFRTGFPDQLMTYGQSASWCCQRARVGIRSLRMGMSRFFQFATLICVGHTDDAVCEVHIIPFQGKEFTRADAGTRINAE